MYDSDLTVLGYLHIFILGAMRMDFIWEILMWEVPILMMEGDSDTKGVIS